MRREEGSPCCTHSAVRSCGSSWVVRSSRSSRMPRCWSRPPYDEGALIVIAGGEIHGFPKRISERIELDTTGGKVRGSVVRKGTEILRIELEPSTPATIGDFAVLTRAETDAAGGACLPLASYLFKFSPNTAGTGFDCFPRLIRQVTLFRRRADLRRGDGRVVVTSSSVRSASRSRRCGPRSRG